MIKSQLVVDYMNGCLQKAGYDQTVATVGKVVVHDNVTKSNQYSAVSVSLYILQPKLGETLAQMVDKIIEAYGQVSFTHAQYVLQNEKINAVRIQETRVYQARVDFELGFMEKL